jgi:hypothetical protein
MTSGGVEKLRIDWAGVWELWLKQFAFWGRVLLAG